MLTARTMLTVTARPCKYNKLNIQVPSEIPAPLPRVALVYHQYILHSMDIDTYIYIYLYIMLRIKMRKCVQSKPQISININIHKFVFCINGCVVP